MCKIYRLSLYAFCKRNKQDAVKSRKNPATILLKSLLICDRLCLMYIIIDGYNLIRQSVSLRRQEGKSLEAGRLALLQTLSDYRRKKGHRITVVFDGWKGGAEYEERDIHEGVEIIYSCYGEKADDVIKKIVERSAVETLVVSSDREIASYAERCGKTALPSPDFENIINRTLFYNGENRNALRGREDAPRGRKKKGPARKPSRAERHLQSKIKKL